jgi:DNA-binding NtrC family response regulator
MRVPAVAVVLAIVLAGCGESGDDRLSREEYIRQADEICAEYDRRLDELPDPTNVRDLETLAQRAFPIAQEGIAKLRTLEPPEELARDVSRWLRLNDANARSIHRLEEAAARGATREVQRIASEAADNERKADELAKKIGLKDCAAGRA